MTIRSPRTIGVSGTRKGWTDAQKDKFQAYCLITQSISILHHGDCVGVDAQACAFAQSLGIHTISHPPINEDHRAHTEGNAIVLQAQKYMQRNRDIVHSVEFMLFVPSDSEMRKTGGTWLTYHASDQMKMPLMLIWPNGVVEQRHTL